MLDRSDWNLHHLKYGSICVTHLFRFFKMLERDELRAWYGPDHVALAADRGAIGTLLISDQLFRQEILLSRWTSLTSCIEPEQTIQNSGNDSWGSSKPFGKRERRF